MIDNCSSLDLENINCPLITCIIVTYKQREYLIENIKSVLMQDYLNIEIIVSDDGTPDFDEDVIRNEISASRKKINNLIIIHHEKNVGTVKNINSALSKSNGEYIKIIGGDDSYPSIDVFSRQVQVLESDKNAYLVIGMSQQCDHSMTPIYDSRVVKGNEALKLLFELEYNKARRYITREDIFPIVTQAICFSKRFFKIYGYYDEQYAVLDDSLLALKVLQCSKNVRVIDKVCVNHRSNVGISTSRDFFSPRRLLYYHDCAIYAENEIAPLKEIYGFVFRFETPRISWFQYYMCLSKSNHESLSKRVLIICKYFDSVIYYAVTRPLQLVRRFSMLITKYG